MFSLFCQCKSCISFSVTSVEIPYLSFASVLAPALINALTVSVFPFTAANKSAVFPSLFNHLIVVTCLFLPDLRRFESILGQLLCFRYKLSSWENSILHLMTSTSLSYRDFVLILSVFLNIALTQLASHSVGRVVLIVKLSVYSLLCSVLTAVTWQTKKTSNAKFKSIAR